MAQRRKRNSTISSCILVLGSFIGVVGCDFNPTEREINNLSESLKDSLSYGVENEPDSIFPILDSIKIECSKPDSIYLEYLTGRLFAFQGKYSDATKIVERLIQHPKDGIGFYYALKLKSLLEYGTNDFSNAVKTLRRLTKLSYAHTDSVALCYTIANMSSAYHGMGMLDSSVYYQDSAISLSLEYQNDTLASKLSADLIPIYIDYERLDTAEKLLIKIQKEPWVTEVDRSINFINLGFIYEKRGDFSAAFNYYQQSKEIALEMGDSSSVAHADNNSAFALYNRGEYKRAFEIYQRASNLMLRLRNDQFTRDIQEFELKYNDLERDARLELLETQTEADRLFRIRLILGFVLIGSLLLSLFLIARSRLKTVRNLRKEEQKRFEKEKELAAMHSALQTLEDERQRVAMDLHDGIGTLSNAAKLWVSQVESSVTEKDAKSKLLETKEVLTQISNDVRKIAHNIMPSSLQKLGLASAIEEFTESIKAASNIEIVVNVDELSWDKNDSRNLVLYRIVQELVNNGVKHSQAEVISLEISVQDDHVLLTYEDDGKGMDASKSQNGNGLHTMKSRIEFAGGKMHIPEYSMQGFRIQFTLPI